MSTTVATAAAASVVANVAGSSSTSQELTVADRKRAALFGMYVGDATAMPVHWMYNLYQLQTDYGRIEGYVKPKDRFEGSIMNLSNTGGGGRGSDQGDIIGSVINHGKKKYWGRGGNYHYHLGLEAGENTLEAQLTRLLAKGIIEGGDFDQAAWLQNYIRFMTTPGSHNDTCKFLEVLFISFVDSLQSPQMPRPVIECSSRIMFGVNHQLCAPITMVTTQMLSTRLQTSSLSLFITLKAPVNCVINASQRQ